MTETELAAVARTYMNAGLAVFPLWWPADTPTGCACPDPKCGSPAKHPITRNGVKDATTDLDTGAAWWSRWPHANIGMPAHDNGFAVLDIDTGPGKDGAGSYARLCAYLAQRGEPMPDTLTQDSGGGGFHQLFAAPDGGITGRANAFGPDMPGLDTRGRGTYLVAAPSLHRSGRRYAWRNFLADLAPWPPILSRLMDPPRPAVPVVTRHHGPPSDKYAAAALAAELDELRAAREPGRNDQLNRSSFALGTLVGAGLLDEGTVRTELFSVAVAIGLGESESVKTILSGLRGGRAKPRTAVGS